QDHGGNSAHAVAHLGDGSVAGSGRPGRKLVSLLAGAARGNDTTGPAARLIASAIFPAIFLEMENRLCKMTPPLISPAVASQYLATGRKDRVMSSPAPLPPGAKAKLKVLKAHTRAGKTYGVKEGGITFIGRAGPQPVDLNLDEHEKPGNVFAQNRHANV